MPAEIGQRTKANTGTDGRVPAISDLPIRNAAWLPKLAAVCCAVAMALATALTASAQTVRLQDNIAPDAMRLQPIVPADPLKPLSLSVQFITRNQAAMAILLHAQQDPRSPQYHQWLTPEQYSERFGPTEKDFVAVSNWLSTSGFQISGGSRQEGLIRFTGDVAVADRAFDVRIMTLGDGSKFANTTAPAVPVPFASVIGEILGLHNLGRLEPDLRTISIAVTAPTETLRPFSTKRSSANLESSPAIDLGPLGINDTTFGPIDFYRFYDETPLVQANIDGTVANDCIGLFETSNVFPDILGDFTDPGILDYELPAISLSIDLVDTSNPGVNSSEDEAYLDIEWSHAVAPGAQILPYVADLSSDTPLGVGQALRDALGAAVTQNKCGAISISFQTCGFSNAFYKHTLDAIFSRAALQGQTVFVSSGDRGVDACNEGRRNVNELAASPFVVAVGGTQFEPAYDGKGNDIGSVPESAWNESLQSNAGRNETTGGGASGIFAKPSWQRGVGVPKDGKRDLPDVAMIAGPPSVLEALADDPDTTPLDSQIWQKGGGTSLAAPIWAGISRLIQQETGTRLGNMNPNIYRLANEGLSHSGFRDVTTGNNTYVNSHDKTVTGYEARPGYDLTTGWGTVDINTFVKAYVSTTTGATSQR